MDDTFKVCPRLFYQLYIIHSHCYNTVLPKLFCLLPDKQTTTYHRLFTLIQSKCIDHQIALSPSTIIVDFEVAVHNVVRSVFPNSTLHGCLFHYGQALYRKLQEVCLSSNRHSDHDAIMKWFRLFIGVAFVPSAQVTTAFALIKEHYTPNCRWCKEFNLYFFDIWLTGSYPVPIWNQFGAEVPRTNNDCEGYNSRLAKRALKPHLNVYELILLFRDEQLNKEAYVLQIEGGQQPAKRRRRCDHVDSKLYEDGLEYITCELNFHSYLSACFRSESGCWN